MKKCLIVCWIGKIPNYFEFWEKSCSYNKDYDFILFTDQNIKSKSNNVKIINISIKTLEELILEKLGFNVNLKYSYKLCDFKPTYGKLFEDYIKEYSYWGHCDIDMIFGKINNFISDNVLQNYEKINKNGHFVLYKNNDKMKNLYKLDGGKFDYKEVYENMEHYAFDEYEGINKITVANKIKEYNTKEFVDVDVRHKRYLDVNGNNYKNQLFMFKNGHIYHIFEDTQKIMEVEKMYLHFQKKKPNILTNNKERFLITDKGFLDYTPIDESNINQYNSFKGDIYEKFENIEYYIKKIIEFLRLSRKQKIICIKRKI